MGFSRSKSRKRRTPARRSARSQVRGNVTWKSRRGRSSCSQRKVGEQAALRARTNHNGGSMRNSSRVRLRVTLLRSVASAGGSGHGAPVAGKRLCTPSNSPSGRETTARLGTGLPGSRSDVARGCAEKNACSHEPVFRRADGGTQAADGAVARRARLRGEKGEQRRRAEQALRPSCHNNPQSPPHR